MKNPSFIIWVGWLGATAVAALMLSSFAYTNFETKKDADDKKADLAQRLDRLENKVDKVYDAVK